jgi:hypothetical protein
MYAAASAITNAVEKSAGCGKMNRQPTDRGNGDYRDHPANACRIRLS